MKDWYTIGEFAKRVGVSTKALRLYEQLGLLRSHTRGDNGYRYYQSSQMDLACRIKEFKSLGFSLAEIKSLLSVDQDLGSQKIVQAMQQRLALITAQVDQLESQKKQVEIILTSLERKTEPLQAQQRRAIMSLFGKVSIVVTGRDGLNETAHYIQKHFENAGQSTPILTWSAHFSPPESKPFILVIPEENLHDPTVRHLHPDVIVIKNLSEHSERTQSAYLNLYTGVGPHVNTVLNADDRAAVELASQGLLKKGRIFYFSKNRALEPQIKRIGGVVSDGEEVRVFGFNLKPAAVDLRLPGVMAFADEIALLSSLGAVLTVGLTREQLALS